ncbi:MAG: hypothetical protein AB2L24_21845 [Mangrovibacterium sp.]
MIIIVVFFSLLAFQNENLFVLQGRDEHATLNSRIALQTSHRGGNMSGTPAWYGF